MVAMPDLKQVVTAVAVLSPAIVGAFSLMSKPLSARRGPSGRLYNLLSAKYQMVFAGVLGLLAVVAVGAYFLGQFGIRISAALGARIAIACGLVSLAVAALATVVQTFRKDPSPMTLSFTHAETLAYYAGVAASLLLLWFVGLGAARKSSGVFAGAFL